MATGQPIEKISMEYLFLGDYTQTLNVSSKSVTMRAHPCLVLTENGYSIAMYIQIFHLNKCRLFN